jgi:hypothetical protein
MQQRGALRAVGGEGRSAGVKQLTTVVWVGTCTWVARDQAPCGTWKTTSRVLSSIYFDPALLVCAMALQAAARLAQLSPVARYGGREDCSQYVAFG